MKSIASFLFSLLCILVLGSCSDSNLRVAQGSPYTLSGTLWQDSVIVDSVVTLFIDRHEVSNLINGDTLPAFEVVEVPVVDGHFFYQGQIPLEADELYLYDQHRHVVHLYGLSGAKLDIRILENGEIQDQSIIDTTALLKAILLRDSIPVINDSLRVRRILGGIPAEAKPDWLVQSINDMLDQHSRNHSKIARMPRVSIQTQDTIYPMLGNRSETLLIYFWSTEDSASVDSLSRLTDIARDYGLHEYADTFEKNKSVTRRDKARRIALFSICMNAPDSAVWKSLIKDVAGYHAILPGGYAHPLAVSCRIHQLPSLTIVDRFGNYQVRDVWNDELYKWLDKAQLNSDVNLRLIKK